MMPNFSQMQQAQSDHMWDRCDLLVRTETGTDENGMPIVSFVVAGSSACGLNTTAIREMINAEYHVFDARLRLPLAVQINGVDRIKVTHRHQSLLTEPVEYEVLGDSMIGPSAQVLNLRSL